MTSGPIASETGWAEIAEAHCRARADALAAAVAVLNEGDPGPLFRTTLALLAAERTPELLDALGLNLRAIPDDELASAIGTTVHDLLHAAAGVELLDAGWTIAPRWGRHPRFRSDTGRCLDLGVLVETALEDPRQMVSLGELGDGLVSG